MSIHTFSYTFENPINREKFEQFLTTLDNKVLRAKELIPFEDNTYIFQYTPTNYTLDPLDWSVSIEKMVFIGTGMDKKSIYEDIKSCEISKVKGGYRILQRRMFFS